MFWSGGNTRGRSVDLAGGWDGTTDCHMACLDYDRCHTICRIAWISSFHAWEVPPPAHLSHSPAYPPYNLLSSCLHRSLQNTDQEFDRDLVLAYICSMKSCSSCQSLGELIYKYWMAWMLEKWAVWRGKVRLILLIWYPYGDINYMLILLGFWDIGFSRNPAFNLWITKGILINV